LKAKVHTVLYQLAKFQIKFTQFTTREKVHQNSHPIVNTVSLICYPVTADLRVGYLPSSCQMQHRTSGMDHWNISLDHRLQHL